MIYTGEARAEGWSDDGRTVNIAGREFALGAVYAAREPRPSGPCPCARRLLGHDPAYPWPGGRVEVELVPADRASRVRTLHLGLSGRAWAGWAGERVGP